MKNSSQLKKFLPDLIVIISFILISFLYFVTPIMDGRVITQEDSLAAIGQGQEQRDFMKRHDDERTRWNLSMFGGMPSYQMSPTYNSSKPQDLMKKAYSLFLPNYVYLVFIMLLGFYILMRAFRASPLISALGAIVWAFSSYFFILISVGHIWKFITLAYIPPTIAGLVYVYRKKYLQGALLIMIFVTFQISANHIQMSYYFFFLMFFMVVAFCVQAIREKKLAGFLKSTAVVVIAGMIGVLANFSNLYHTYEYSKETIRGKSELSHHGVEDKSKNELERDYITGWSYGIDEIWTLLVPNTKGGSSYARMSENLKAMEKARPEYRELYKQIAQYWGEQPWTAGPVYVGAFVLTLFILGLFIVKGPVKWALLAGTLFSILLSWGKNFMPLTDFFINYIPMYNKFRTVSSILVVAEFCIPLLAALAVKEIVQKPAILKNNMKYVSISWALTGGMALLFWLSPKLFFPSYISNFEMQQLQFLPTEHVQAVIENLTKMRISIFRADAWRSFYIILGGVLMLIAFVSGKLKTQWTVAGILLLCLADMWTVNKRYLNDKNFTPKSNEQRIFAQTPTDQRILQDTTKYYRVLNMATSTFNDGVTPYYHKTIGGYHAAKLRRYQDLIDIHLIKEMKVLQQDIIRTQGTMDSVNADNYKVLNMLNTKWIIMPTQDGTGTVPVENPYVMGNAWFVDNIRFVDNADEEINALATIDLSRQAVADKKFESVLQGFNVSAADSASAIMLANYDSNFITYTVDAKKNELAVFSEIYYPKGWQITIDGQPAQMLRANYTLRALPIPKGTHTVEFRFEPASIKVTDAIAFAALFVLLLTAAWIVFRSVKQNKQKQ